jgi:hypothetical protein
MNNRAADQTALTLRFGAALTLFVLIMAVCFGYLAPEVANYQQMTLAADDAATNVMLQLNDLSARKIRDDADRKRFDELEKDGFVGPQNRLNAARVLEQLRQRHRISGMEYQIDPAETISIIRQPEGTGEKLTVSEISLSIRGFLDRDLRDFTAAVKRDFPGFITITEVEMEKIETPTSELLSQIRVGQGTELLRGSVKLLWQVLQINQDEGGS